MVSPESGGITLDVDQRFVLRCLSRFKSVMCVFPRGFSKCIAGDSLLFTDEGIKEIGAYFDYQDDDVETYTKHNIGMLNKHGEIEYSDKGVYSGYRDTKIVKTEEGYEIEGTGNHPLLVMKEDGVLDWVNIEDINQGDFLAISRKNDIWGSNTKLDIDMDIWLSQFNAHEKGAVNRSVCNLVDELSEEMALILGYLIGDGCLTRDNVILFSNADDDILSNYKKFMEETLGIRVAKMSGDNYDYVSYGKYVREYFRQIGLPLEGAHTKEVPQCILSAPKEMVRQFLIGLFDADGTVTKTRVSITTASEKLSKQVQAILLNFGIISTRAKRYNKEFKTYSYTTDMYGANIDLFHERIGFGCDRKTKILEEVILINRNTNKDIIPYQRNIVNETFENIRDMGLHNPLLFDNFYHIRKGNNEMTYSRVDQFLESYGSEVGDKLDYFDRLRESNYFFSKVKTVECNKNHVYDVQMPETQSFVANGIVNHNTFLNLLYNFHTSIFYPNMEIALTAQTHESAVALVREKWRELTRFFPILESEMQGNPRFSTDGAEVTFKSGGVLDTLINNQSAKGTRRRRITVEEYAQVDNDIFDDVIRPIPDIPRITVGKRGTVNPYELNGQINYFTTSWFVGKPNKLCPLWQ